jgi:phosphatidylglycerophosphate synthase
MTDLPWDQRIARVLVRPLVATPVTPNHLTFVTLVIALAGAGFFAAGTPEMANWGAGLFVLARFLDHFDGELARQKGQSSRFGYYFDYVTGALSYGALFLCMGIGLRQGPLDQWALVLGFAGLASAIVSLFINLDIDKRHALIGKDAPRDSVGYPGFAGFELEDGIYLLAPITWLGYLAPFFVAAGIGAAVYTLWSLWILARLRR